MEHELWHTWYPAEGVSGKYTLQSIDDAIGAFTIYLTGEHPHIKPIRVVFDESIDISRVTQITYCTATLEWLTQTYGTNFYSQWTFFTVTDSHFIKWLKDESLDLLNSSFTHFVFLGSNYLVEIVAGYEPTIIFE